MIRELLSDIAVPDNEVIMNSVKCVRSNEMVFSLQRCVGMLLLLLSFSAFAEPPKGWLPHSPSPESSDAPSALIVGQ